jgi:hypothetical protein
MQTAPRPERIRKVADPGSGPERVRYRFGPLERRGLIAGWRGGQIGSVAAGLVVGVLALRAYPSVPGVLIAVGAVGAGVAGACWPVGGRTGDQWLPLAVRWLVTTVRTGRVQSAPVPGRGQLVVSGPDGAGAHRSGAASARSACRWWEGSASGVFDSLRIASCALSDQAGSPAAGVVMDGRSRTATAVLAVRGHSFALLGPDDQDARLGGWARVLAALAREGSDVHRVQWVESCLPDDGTATRTHQRDRAVLGVDTAPGRSYASLVDHSAPVTRRHRVLLAVSVHTAHSSRAIRASGGGDRGTGAVLLREAVALQRLLEDADATVEGILGPGALATVFRQSSAPMAAVGGTDGDGTGGDGPSTGWPWPMAVASEWDAVHTDATWHATYWIAEWPRVDVTPDFLGPLLFSPLRRSISLVMEPMSPTRAARQVAQARTADIADGELRRRGGFLVTARQVREKEGVEHRDAELADGHAQYRFSGYVTVTADDPDELRQGCAAVEQAAGQARMELRRLYGEQDVAFACTLPLGRGLS